MNWKKVKMNLSNDFEMTLSYRRKIIYQQKFRYEDFTEIKTHLFSTSEFRGELWVLPHRDYINVSLCIENCDVGDTMIIHYKNNAERFIESI